MRRLTSNPTTREDIKIRKANLKKNTALFRRDLFLDDKGLLRWTHHPRRRPVPHQTPSHHTEKRLYYVTSHAITINESIIKAVESPSTKFEKTHCASLVEALS